MLPLCRAEGIGVIPWSPLARGFLAGNRKRGAKDATKREQYDEFGHGLYYAEDDYDIADRVVQVAREKNVLPIQVALAWVTQQPGITAPIVGASRLEQLDQLIEGLSVTLTEDDRRFLEENYAPHPVLGH
jgi:aryl-alcohol dehydrogenase (NADP+)